MSFVLLFLLGFSTSFIGTIPPSMLNMTTAKISVDSNKPDALKFALGVSIIVFIQAYVALLFAKYIHNNVTFDRYISMAGILIFLFLSAYFFKQAKKEKQTKTSSSNKRKNSFLFGLILSSLNMFAIPFYCGVGSALNSVGWLNLDDLTIILFVLGSAAGTFALLGVYANSARLINNKAKILSKNLNYALSLLTAFVAVITLIRIL